MRPRAILLTILLVGISGAALATLEHFVGGVHMRKRLGRSDIGDANCFNCHFVSTNRLLWAKSRPHHDAPAGLAVSPDGKKIYIALDERDEVAEADTATRQVIRRAKLPGGPYGLAIAPGGHQLFVTCRTGDRLAVLDTQTLTQTGSVPVGMAPVAVAFCRTEKGDRLVVANSMSDDVSIISLSPLEEVARQPAGREPFAISVTPDGSRVFIANRMVNLDPSKTVPVTEVTVVDPRSARVVRRESLESAHLCEGVCTVPGRPWAIVPMVKVRNLVPITQVANGWVMSSGIAITDVKQGGTIQLPLDEANNYFSDPSGIIVDPAGNRAYIASGGSDAITVVDLERLDRWLQQANERTKSEAIYDLSLAPEYVAARIPCKRNPKQLVLSPDAGKLYVSERLEDSVLVVDTQTLAPAGRIVLGDGGLDDPVRRGERVFTTSAYTFQHQFSCRSCHPDGHVDGLSYDFDGDGIGDNLLDNRSLQGVAGTGPFKWNGKNPSVKVQCGPRFAKVLMRTEPFPKQQLQDLTTFIQSLPPGRTRTTEDPKLLAAQERGRAIFLATRTPDGKEIPLSLRCVTCHPPPLYSVRLSFNVDSKGAFDSSDKFDTPHLLGVADTAPYLHDGRAKTLEELWTVYSTNDLHGVSSYMNKIQLNDLVEFLKTL